MAEDTQPTEETLSQNVESIADTEPGFEDFLNARSTTNPRSIRMYRQYIGAVRRFCLVSGVSEKPLLKLTATEARQLSRKMKDVVRVVNGEQRQGFSGPIFAVTRMFYRFHKKPEHADAFKVRVSKPRMRPDSVPTIEEINALINASPSLRDSALIALLADTGARIHEALALKLKDVEVLEAERDGKKERLVRIFFPKVKISGEERRVLLEPESGAAVLMWLENYPKDVPGGKDRPLFPSHAVGHYGKPLTTDAYRDQLKLIAKRAGLDKERIKILHPHSLRHYAATRLLRQGWTEAKVKARLGWVPGSQMLSRYSHLVSEDVDNEMLARNGFAVAEAQRERFVIPSGEAPAMPQPEFTTYKRLMDDPGFGKFLDAWLMTRAKALGIDSKVLGPMTEAEAEPEAYARDTADESR